MYTLAIPLESDDAYFVAAAGRSVWHKSWICKDRIRVEVRGGAVLTCAVAVRPGVPGYVLHSAVRVHALRVAGDVDVAVKSSAQCIAAYVDNRKVEI